MIQQGHAKNPDIWNGDMEQRPDLNSLNVKDLKAIIRFFQIRNVEQGLTLKGRKDELRAKVRHLFETYPHAMGSQ